MMKPANNNNNNNNNNNSSNSSLFNDHMIILSKTADLDARQHIELKRIEDIELPTLKLPEQNSFQIKSEFRSILDQLGSFVLSRQAVVLSLSFAAVVGAMVYNIDPHPNNQFTAKGAVRVSLYFERGGNIQPLAESSVLQNGDKVGANIISSQNARAYWAVLNHKQQLLSESSDILDSQIVLEAGVHGSFRSSFTIVAPNEGEHLLVIVCQKKSVAFSEISQHVKKIMTHEKFSQIFELGRLNMGDCLYVGRRLRKLGLK